MEVKVRELIDNKEVLNAARTTSWMKDLEKQPSIKFMEDIYMAEHSPIYTKCFMIEIYGVKRWIADHLVRHHVGVTPFMSTQREDRNSNVSDRDSLGQGELVNLKLFMNAESIINASRKRLCNKAHKETKEVWKKVLNELSHIDTELFDKCVPNCIYRGFCSEIKSCGWCNTNMASVWRSDYIGSKPKIKEVKE